MSSEALDFARETAVEAAGHTCVLYLYDRYGGDLDSHTAVIRAGWPELLAEVHDARGGATSLDGLVASSWPTAHVALTRFRLPTRRFYFIQDYEPFFHAQGSSYALAEDSYRFGFRAITVGRMVAEMLRDLFDVDAAVAEFGCDTGVYHLDNDGDRSGVVFYTRPGVARRGFELGMLALAEFHRRHPEQTIHTFGERVADAPFPLVQHGRQSAASLNELYNRTCGGLALSFTNVSLVPDEMLAAGCIPVVNDSAYARVGLPSPEVRWAQASPRALARALCDVVEAADPVGQARRASASVQGRSWEGAETVVVETIEQEVYGPSVA